MCIIAVVPKEKRLVDEVLHNCWTLNSQGAGFAYAKDGKIHVIKELASRNKFEYLYKKHQELAPESTFVLHWRVRTHGTVSLENVHPFWVNKDLVMFHNGTITGMPDDKQRSDSNLFNRLVLQRLPAGWKHSKAILHLLQDRINGSRMAFLSSTGKVTVLNRQAWNESTDGIMFSNDGWKGSWMHRNKSDLYVLDKETQRFIRADSVQKKTTSPKKIRAEYDALLRSCDPCVKHASATGALIQVMNIDHPDLILHIAATATCACCKNKLENFSIMGKVMDVYFCEDCLIDMEDLGERYLEGRA